MISDSHSLIERNETIIYTPIANERTLIIYASSSLEIENMRKMHKGIITKAAIFSKSSLSLEITPILDQSPLYLEYFECYYTGKIKN